MKMETQTRSTPQESNSTTSSTFSLDRTSLSGHCTSFTLDVEYQSKTQQTVECSKVVNDIQVQCALLMDGNTTTVEGDELIGRLTKQKIAPSRVIKALRWYLLKYGRGIFINRGMQAGLHLDVKNTPSPNELLDNVYSSLPEPYIANTKPSQSLGSINKNESQEIPRRRSTSLATVTSVYSVVPKDVDRIKKSKQRFKSCIPLAIKTTSKKSKALVKSTPLSHLPVRRGFETKVPIYSNTLEGVCKTVDFSSQIDLKPKYLITQSTETHEHVQQFSQTDVPNLENNFIEKIHGVFNKGSTVWIAIKQSPLSSFSIKSSCSFSHHVDEKSRQVGHVEFASSMETVVCKYKKSDSEKVKPESKIEVNPWNLSPSLMDRVRCYTSLSNVPTDDQRRMLGRCQAQSRSRLVYYGMDQKKSLRLPHSVGKSSKERNSRTKRMAQSDPSLFGIVRKERTTGSGKALVRKTSKRTTLALAHKAVSGTDIDLSSYVQEQPRAKQKVQVLYQSDASTLTVRKKGSKAQMQKWEKSIVQTEKTLHNLRQKITHLNELLKRGGKEEMLGIHYFNSAKRCVRKSTCPNVTRSMMCQTTRHASSRNYQRRAAAEERVECHNRQRCQCMKDPPENFPHVPSVPLHLLVPHSVI
ncbi:hypothetical protein PPYR_09787 [Photinus pyralis]|uniref:Uncharacterized protein n=1 Tax=Photinus pyralis TaxID=7054 RepID=A0A1Y1M5K9_PHOPY|nr:uncharacterized protein LOC116173387 [Photinus pyralis]KAB0795726.1 hypothetical protein PPYR_09787 [Photinus pyralis]